MVVKTRRENIRFCIGRDENGQPKSFFYINHSRLVFHGQPKSLGHKTYSPYVPCKSLANISSNQLVNTMKVTQCACYCVQYCTVCQAYHCVTSVHAQRRIVVCTVNETTSLKTAVYHN